jgi:DNA gyrase subunit B
VLSNAEIQSLVQVIGTGIGEEFDIAKLRYHKIVVMTDADVDGAHIRTLVLTFLYRHMPQLFDRGHVYIAVPPLYLVKMGNQQTYLEKDSQLEDLLVRGKFADLVIHDRDDEQVKLTEARYGRFQAALHEFEGWSARLRSDFGIPAVDFVIGHRLVEDEAESAARAKDVLAAAANGYALEPSLVDGGLKIRVIEAATGAAHTVQVPEELLASPVYARLRTAYERLAEIVGGRPPFHLQFGNRQEHAETFEELRARSLELAKQGMQITRFKGLGEMNAEELWATTMDPSRRLLIRADVDDESAADTWFSRLMGDEVEPRRVFIEENALDVRFLDV